MKKIICQIDPYFLLTAFFFAYCTFPLLFFGSIGWALHLQGAEYSINCGGICSVIAGVNFLIPPTITGDKLECRLNKFRIFIGMD